MLDYQEISLNICILTTLYTIVHYFPYLKNYSNDIRFSIYRSLMCITFTFMGANILLTHYEKGSLHPFSYKHVDMIEGYNLFLTYLIVDIINMIATKAHRFDLYIHHCMCIIGLLISNYTNRFGYIQSIILICEALSIVSGIDSMAMNDNDNKLSYYCKKIRKYVIKYIRYPIWTTALLSTVYFINKLPKLLSIDLIASCIIMLYMDKYWKKKCEKVIEKYEKS